MYSDKNTNIGNISPPSSSPARFAAVTVRLRKNVSGSSGAAERASITMNPAISAAAPASRPTVAAEAQPWLAAVTTAYTSSDRPPVTVTAPATSNRRRARLARLSGSSGRAAATISAPTGRLTKKIHGQDSQVVSIPPASTPIAPPAPLTAPTAPSALACYLTCLFAGFFLGPAGLAVFPTSWRVAGRRFLEPGGRPGPGLPGFGAAVRAGSAPWMFRNPWRTRAGVRRPGGAG